MGNTISGVEDVQYYGNASQNLKHSKSGKVNSKHTKLIEEFLKDCATVLQFRTSIAHPLRITSKEEHTELIECEQDGGDFQLLSSKTETLVSS